MNQNFKPSPWHPTEKVTRTIEAGSKAIGLRLDVFVARFLTDYSRQEVQKLIENRAILVNNTIKKAAYRLNFGDRVLMNLPRKVPFHQIPSEQQLPVIYEDEWLLAINKPAGMVVHPTRRHLYPTVMSCLVSMFNGSNRQPKPVHRLDRDVSGILLIAKEITMARYLTDLFKNKRIVKQYLALIDGEIVETKQLINKHISYVDKRGNRINRSAVTLVELVQQFHDTALVRIIPETGRQHQIRRHLSLQGTPIVGDKRYGSRFKSLSRIALHAACVSFFHPETQNHLAIEAPIPEDFLDIVRIISCSHQSLNRYNSDHTR